MKFAEERTILEQQNIRIDKTIDLLSKIKIRGPVKDRLLDAARETKAIIANIVRLIDGQ